MRFDEEAGAATRLVQGSPEILAEDSPHQHLEMLVGIFDLELQLPEAPFMFLVVDQLPRKAPGSKIYTWF